MSKSEYTDHSFINQLNEDSVSRFDYMRKQFITYLYNTIKILQKSMLPNQNYLRWFLTLYESWQHTNLPSELLRVILYTWRYLHNMYGITRSSYIVSMVYTIYDVGYHTRSNTLKSQLVLHVYLSWFWIQLKISTFNKYCFKVTSISSKKLSKERNMNYLNITTWHIFLQKMGQLSHTI